MIIGWHVFNRAAGYNLFKPATGSFKVNKTFQGG
jgi:hypothetical protein